LSQERIHYPDWLKVLIVYGIVLFFVSLVFSMGTWLVSNHDRSLILTAFAGFTLPWGIPAMFLIAGADAWFGVRSRTAPDFVRWHFLVTVVALTLGINEFGVRRWAITRLVFGLYPLPQACPKPGISSRRPVPAG